MTRKNTGRPASAIPRVTLVQNGSWTMAVATRKTTPAMKIAGTIG
jgi:hypothetical protein